jgi:ribose transport system substrate-binding protein
MKRLMKTVLVLLAIGVVLAFTACSQSQSAPAAPAESATRQDQATDAESSADEATGLSRFTEMGMYKDEPPFTIGYSFHGGGISFDIQSINAFEWVLENRYSNVIDEYYITEAQFDVNKQISDIEDLIAKGIDGLVVSPTSPSAIIPVLDRLYDQGIPVVVVLGEYDGSKYTAYRATDGRAFGRAGAEWLVEQLIERNGEAKGNVIAIRGVAGMSADVARWDRGAKPVFDSYPNINVVGEAEGLWAYDEARRVASSLLAAHPDVDGIWSCGGQMSLAAGEVLLEKGMDLVPITGEDYNGFFKFWIEHKAEGFSSISPTYPSWIATQGLEVLMNVLAGESVQRTILYPPPTITDDTVERFVINDLPDMVWVASSIPHGVMADWYANLTE